MVSIITYIKLIPTFERNLQKLNNNSAKTKKRNIKIFDRLLKIICLNREERIFFRFASNMMINEREFKLKVYPTLGFALILPFIFIFNELKDLGWNSVVSSRMYLNIYFCTLVNYGVYIYIVVMIIVDMFIWKKAFNISLEQLGKFI